MLPITFKWSFPKHPCHACSNAAKWGSKLVTTQSTYPGAGNPLKCASKALTPLPHEKTPHLPLHTLTVHSISLLVDSNHPGTLFCFIFITCENTKQILGKFKCKRLLDCLIIRIWLWIWYRDSNILCVRLSLIFLTLQQWLVTCPCYKTLK